ncbi:concanavalin A-like lectin/glucanase domain-containing protein [Xylariomycetidae sp. FL2044]|nr:concanavalin A-like lectin/glucanase domain-containing protein [Xylariomycetidae sp. FL2044]
MLFSRERIAAAAATALLSTQATAQTYSDCNPTTSTCPADSALGMTIDVDFTQGEVNSFTSSGGTPTYGSDGVTFTVAQSGDAPQLNSVFYIMFGRVEVELKAAPGAGIVSSFVLQSDDLDEIDWEWLGSDDPEVQTNYFGKGITGSYNRGQFHQLGTTQSDFRTYVVDWTDERIVWTVDDTVVRSMTVDEAESGQYPQTPMQIRFGAWAGGDSSNPQGTIEWARGPTDYSQGPFSMSVKSVKITDYSTGTSYSYGDTSGTWESIVSDGGEVNGNADGAGALTTTAVASAATSTSTASVPAGGIGGTSSTGSSSDLPEGWIMTSEGKIMPSSSATVLATPSSSPSPSLPWSQGAGSSGLESTTATSQKPSTVMPALTGFTTLPQTGSSEILVSSTSVTASTPSVANSELEAATSDSDASVETKATAPDLSGTARIAGLTGSPMFIIVFIASALYMLL